MKRTPLAVVCAGMSALTLIPGYVRAVDYTWLPTAAGTYDWSLAANWDPVGPPILVGDTANLAIATAGNQAINILSDHTIAGLTLGSGFNTDVGNAGAGAGALVFEGATVINSLGTAVNTISAPMRLNANVSIGSTSVNGLTLSGVIQPNNGDRNLANNVANKQVLVNGNVLLYDALVPLTSRNFQLNSNANTTTVINAQFVRGDGVITGNTGSVQFNIGGAQPTAVYILNVAQTIPAIELNKNTFILAHDQALGVGTMNARSNNNNSWGAELQSTDDARKIANNIASGNGVAITGEHSLTIDGWLSQSNNRGFGNMLPAGKVLTLTGANPDGVSIYCGNSGNNRNWIMDGTGTTIVNGSVKNHPGDDATFQNFRKQGSGVVFLNGTGSTYSGSTTVTGGLLEFGVLNAWGNTTGITASPNGAVWFTPGTANAGFTAFLDKIVNTSSGILALPDSELATSFDFNAASYVNASGMTIGVRGAKSYTGAVTPGATGYHWGGATGVLTLAGNDRMVGPNAVRYGNGGTVILTGTHSYEGPTTLAGANMATAQVNIANKTGSTTGTTNIFQSTVLEITQISNGGVPSTLGASTSDAANLVFNGGTLRYLGNGSTDRLFTVNSGGAFIDASGTGPLQFTNIGANLSSGGAANRTLTLMGTNTGINSIAGTMADSGVGSVLSVTKAGPNRWDLHGDSSYTGTTTVSAGLLRATHANALGLGPLTVTGGKAEYASGLSTATKHTALNITSPGVVDLADNDMVIDYTTGPNPALEDAVRLHLLNGRLTTSAVAPSGTKLGYADNAAFTTPLTSFGGIAVDTDSILIKFTYSGDTNLDGQVDITDLGTLATNWQAAGPWGKGDFNYDGTIDITDLGQLATNWQAGVGNPLGPSFGDALASVGLGGVSIPEPASVGIVGLCVAGVLARRGRR